MASRPRRAAAQKANSAITDMVDSDNHTNSRTGRTMSSRTSRRSEGKSVVAAVSRDPPSSPSDSNQHIHVTVKLPSSKLRQATSSGRGTQSSRQSTRDSFAGGEIVAGKRNRSHKKSYIVDSSDDDEEDEDEDAEAEIDDEDDDDDDAEGDDDGMADAPGEDEIVVNDDMDIDAEGDDDEEDAEGEDDDMEDSAPPPAPTIKVSKPPAKKGVASKSRSSARASAKAAAPQAKDSDDDDELSELESEADEIQDTIKIGGGGDDEDAEGEDEEIEEADAGPAQEEANLDSDDETGSRAETPDLTKMTKRQRARFEEGGELMKLSDEVQAKKVFTAEELSMRRAEMARRRRNLSEKRNEEVKMETINKLLKKQAPKTKGKSQLALDATPDDEANRPNPVFVRWINNREGSRVAVPDELVRGPAGRVFVRGGLSSGKMVEEVS